MDFIDIKIKETEDWLKANETQATLPTMTIEDELLILDLCHQFRHHASLSISKNEDYKELFLNAVNNGALNRK